MELLTDLSNLAVANESVWVIFKLLREKINVVFLSSKGVTKKKNPKRTKIIHIHPK